MSNKFINLTPHCVMLNDGTEFPPSGQIARVTAEYTSFEDNVAQVSFGEISNLPEPEEGVIFIVSAIVAQAAGRTDVVSPATGHPDAKRNEKGQILSVPGFVRA